MDTERAREKRLEEWISLYGNAVLRTCFIYLADYAQAEDAMQDTFLKAWHSMRQFEQRNNSTEKTWLMRIAINTCHDYHRSKWFRHVDMEKALESLSEPVTVASPDEMLLLRDMLTLPEKYKQMLLLYHYQEMTIEEAAETLGISCSTAHHRLKKAEALLKGMLTGGEKDESK